MTFWAFIIPILVQLLETFLTDLFTTVNPPIMAMRSPLQMPSLAGSRSDFVAKVRFRIWLGPHRKDWAGALYDRMLSRMSGVTLQSTANLVNTVAFATDGLAKLQPSDLEPKLSPGAQNNFTVISNGLVQGGTASYTLDSVTGTIAYQAAIKVGKWFISKTYNFSGTYQVDPAILNPANLSVGKTITMGPLQMRVVSITQNSAMVSLSVPGSATGTAILSTNQPVLTINALDATVSVMGLSLVLGVRAA